MRKTDVLKTCRKSKPLGKKIWRNAQALKSKKAEAVAQRCSVKKVFLEISQNSQENTCAKVYFLIKLQADTCVRVSFLIKLQAACIFIKKETLAQVFFCEFWEISKNTFFYRTPLVAASEKVQGIFGETFISALLCSAVFHLQNRVSNFFCFAMEIKRFIRVP